MIGHPLLYAEATVSWPGFTSPPRIGAAGWYQGWYGRTDDHILVRPLKNTSESPHGFQQHPFLGTSSLVSKHILTRRPPYVIGQLHCEHGSRLDHRRAVTSMELPHWLAAAIEPDKITRETESTRRVERATAALL